MEDLSNANNPVITSPIIYNYTKLPFNELPWGKLEELCHRIASKLFKNNNCSLYGNRGQNQEGFDVYVSLDDSDKYILYQCKQVVSFDGTDLKNAIKKWEIGGWFSKTKKFVVFSSEKLNNTSFIKEFEEQKSRLKSLGIELERQGSSEIGLILKEFPQVVEEFFGPDYRDEFCSPLSVIKYKGSVSFLPELNRIDHPLVQNYIERKLTNLTKEGDPVAEYFGKNEISLKEHVEDCFNKNSLGKEKVRVRIIIRADASVGKTKELENIAFQYSNSGLYPILVRLKNFNGEIEDYIECFYKNWKLIPEDRLMLLFDGLDEIPYHDYNLFIKKFNTFLQKYKGAHIIASIRNNVFTKDIGAGIEEKARLTAFGLELLSRNDVDDYIRLRIIEDQRRRAFEKTRRHWEDLIFNPFYLVGLVDLFLNDSGNMPKNRVQLINKLISLKIANDKEKYGDNLKINELNEFSNKLALYLTLKGENAIKESELRNFTALTLNDIRLFSLIKVENQGLYHIIYFEHNNFQEYLAANSLSLLEWNRLENILFHQKGFKVLKPKMFNTVNFLFTILDYQSIIFQKLLKTLSDYESSFLLKFEKDKIDVDTRLKIFKDIILKGKKDGIYYLDGGLKIFDLCDFVNYSASAFNFLLNELLPDSNENHLYCLLDIIERYQKIKINTNQKAQLKDSILALVSKPGFEYAVYDRAIDVLTEYQFFNNQILSKIIRCPLHEHKMVRGAILKYIEKADYKNEFKYILESAVVITNQSIRIYAGLEELYIRLLLKFLDEKNATILINYFSDNLKTIKKIIRKNSYSDINTNADKLYGKLGNVYQISSDDNIYLAYKKLLVKLNFADYKTKELGNPELFFEKLGDKTSFFWDFLNDKDFEVLDYFLTTFYHEDLIPEIISKYKTKEISRNQLTTIRLNLYNQQHISFQNVLLHEFGDEFKYLQHTNWDEINEQRKRRDFELLQNREEFLKEAKRVYELIKEIKDGEPDDDKIYELEYSEKRDIQQKLNNKIILRTITEYKIYRNYISFKAQFQIDKWNGFVFHKVYEYLNTAYQNQLTTDLIQIAEDYLFKSLLPTLNFKKAYVKKRNGNSYTISHASIYLRSFYLSGLISYPKYLILDMLLLDYDGHLSHDDNNKKLFVVIKKDSDEKLYRERVLKNLNRRDISDQVITTMSRVCADYFYEEALPILLEILERKQFDNRLKSFIVENIIAIAQTNDVFEDFIHKIKKINHEWQLEMCEYLLENNSYKRQLIKLVESSTLITKVKGEEVFWRFRFLRFGARLGVFKVINYVFKHIILENKTESYLRLLSTDFSNAVTENPEEMLKLSFQFYWKQAIKINDFRHNDFFSLNKELIQFCALKDQMLFEYSINEYEKIIAFYINTFPKVSRFKWHEFELIKSYLNEAISYEGESETFELINELCA